MSDASSGLGKALRSKQKTHAMEGAEEAQKAATSAVDWAEVGVHAKERDEDVRPRRRQTNIGLPEDLKREFKSLISRKDLQMRFVVEDLIRLYLEHIDSGD